jgi:hypothetical protein
MVQSPKGCVSAKIRTLDMLEQLIILRRKVSSRLAVDRLHECFFVAARASRHRVVRISAMDN